MLTCFRLDLVDSADKFGFRLFQKEFGDRIQKLQQEEKELDRLGPVWYWEERKNANGETYWFPVGANIRWYSIIRGMFSGLLH